MGPDMNSTMHNCTVSVDSCADFGGLLVSDGNLGLSWTQPKKEINLPEHYVINKKVVMLQWKDGEKTILKLTKDDNFNLRLGFLIAYFQETSGLSKSKANKYLDALEESEVAVRKVKKIASPDELETFFEDLVGMVDTSA